MRWLCGAAVCAVLVFPVSAWAEPLSGTVLDAETLKPVPNATVQARGQEPVTTNARGRYDIKDAPVGRLRVRVTAPGYEPSSETIEVPEGGIDNQVFVILRIGATGETIEITERAPPLVQDTPGQQNLERAELTRIPGARGDPLASIKSLPGVANLGGGGAAVGALVIRGSAPEDSIINIDGIEIPLVFHFFGLQSILPAEFIESIEFVPGGFGAEKGRATGGVISIKTRNQEPTKYSGFAELSFINLAAFVQGPISEKHKVYFTGAFRRSAIDLVLPLVLPDDANLSFTTAPQYYDGQVRLDWRPTAKDRISFLGLFSYDLLSLITEEVNPNEPLFTGFDNETQFTRFITSWERNVGDFESKLTTSIGTSAIRFEIGNERFLRISDWRAELREDFAWKPSESFQLRTGLEGRLDYNDVEAIIPLPPGEGEGGPGNFSTATPLNVNRDIKSHVAAAWATADLRPAPSTAISAGVRYDYYGRINESTVSPRLTLEQSLGDRVVLRGAVGSYTRPLNQAEALPTDVKPERATQYVLGAEYRLLEGVQLTGSGFYTDRRDLIVQDAAMEETDPENAFVNRGNGRSFGMEALLRVKRGNFFGWASYTLSRSDRVDAPGGERRLFDFDQTHNFILVGSYKLGHWQFGGRFQYVTGAPTTPIVGSVYLADANVHVPVYGDVNSDRLSTGHQLDLRIDRKWQFKNWALSAFLDVTNVYANARVLGQDYNFNFTEEEAIEELPIVPAIGVRGSF